MTAEQYQQLTYEEYRQQRMLEYKAKEMLEGKMENRVLYEALNHLMARTVYFKRDAKCGYRIRPIYGKGNWTRELWQKYKQRIEGDKELNSALTAFLFALAMYDGKGYYIEHARSEAAKMGIRVKPCYECKCERCDEAMETCKSEIEECAKAAAYYEPKIAEQYEQIQRGENKSAAFEMVYVTTKTN